MSKHTPAPWKWHDDYSQLYQSKYDCVASDVVVLDGHQMLDGIREVRFANARLIAAAPDLFELVQDMLANFHDQECNDEVIEIVARAKFTIAKVLGESA